MDGTLKSVDSKQTIGVLILSQNGNLRWVCLIYSSV